MSSPDNLALRKPNVPHHPCGATQKLIEKASINVAYEVVQETSFRKCTILGGVLEQEYNALFLAAPRS